MTERRYSLQALIDATGLSERGLCNRVGLSGSSVKKARERGLLEPAADKYAVRAGYHPSEVWPSWFDDYKIYKNPRDGWKDENRRRRAVLAAVEARLRASGAVVEVHQLRRLSTDEAALLVALEMAAPPSDPQAPSASVAA